MAASTTVAPEMKLYRTKIAALDTLPMTDRKQGLNAGSYRTLNVNVVPSDGANPSITVLFWSAVAQAYVPSVPAQVIAGQGVDTPYSFSFDANGRLVFLAVTAGALGNVEIETSGYDMDHSL